jgi:alkylation response protein AidB-like acyl-CoA dehydrogenase
VNFELTDEQRLLRDTAQRFCEREFPKRRGEASRDEETVKHVWRAFTEQAWLSPEGAPEEWELSNCAVTASIVMEEVGRALVLEPILGCAILVTGVVAAALPNKARAEILTAVKSGQRRVAIACSECEAGASPQHVRTVATQMADGSFVIDGSKTLVLGGDDADMFVVSARTAGEVEQPEGIGLFVLSRAEPGLSVESYCLYDGSGACDLGCANVHVHRTMLLADGGRGLQVVQQAIDYGITALCAESVGGMDAVLRLARNHLKCRRQYGVALSEFQALQHRMAEMLIETELSRSALHSALAAWEMPEVEERRRCLWAAKARIGLAAQFVGAQGIQLHGALGMTEEHLVGAYFKRLQVLDALFGGAESHIAKLAESLVDVGGRRNA